MILLTGHDAGRCARRIHNEWEPAGEQVAWEVPAELQMRFDAGREFEVTVFEELRTTLGPERCTDLTPVRGKATAVEATVSAMEAGREVILGGWLPDDLVGGRTGRPDLLLAVGEGHYVPGEVKAHRMTVRQPRGTLAYSLPGAPTTRLALPGLAARTTARLDDHLQLAHYWRMLEAIGRAPGTPASGAVIGTDRLPGLPGPGRVLTWLELSVAAFETYSRSQGVARRSALERYDHEHGFRLRVATTAAAGGEPLAQPIFTDECDSCPWHDHCLGLAEAGTASARITAGRLSVREWQTLSRLGIVTVESLAELDVDDPAFCAAYLPEVTHLKDPLGRLASAVRRARMTRDGVTLERDSSGPVVVPRADVEIDLDIEWDPADRVYLWGAMVAGPDGATEYHPTVCWQDLEESGEVELAAEFADWLRGRVADAEAAGRTVLVYHYAAPEPTRLAGLLGADAVADLLDHFVDLLPILRRHFFGLHGLGIKKVAPAFGFTWRDEDPGGLQSQLWLLTARNDADRRAREAARRRILAYNEDDVRATAAVRRALTLGVPVRAP